MARIDRSEFIKIHQKKDKGRCYNTTMLPVIEKTFQDRYIFSRDGDRLDLLAYQFYNDSRHWIILALANNLGHGTLDVPGGIQLRIPPASVVTTLRKRLQNSEEDR